MSFASETTFEKRGVPGGMDTIFSTILLPASQENFREDVALSTRHSVRNTEGKDKKPAP